MVQEPQDLALKHLIQKLQAINQFPFTSAKQSFPDGLRSSNTRVSLVPKKKLKRDSPKENYNQYQSSETGKINMFSNI